MKRTIWLALCVLAIIMPIAQVVRQRFEDKEALWMTGILVIIGLSGIFFRNKIVPKEEKLETTRRVR